MFVHDCCIVSVVSISIICLIDVSIVLVRVIVHVLVTVVAVMVRGHSICEPTN